MYLLYLNVLLLLCMQTKPVEYVNRSYMMYRRVICTHQIKSNPAAWVKKKNLTPDPARDQRRAHSSSLLYDQRIQQQHEHASVTFSVYPSTLQANSLTSYPQMTHRFQVAKLFRTVCPAKSGAVGACGGGGRRQRRHVDTTTTDVNHKPQNTTAKHLKHSFHFDDKLQIKIRSTYIYQVLRYSLLGYVSRRQS